MSGPHWCVFESRSGPDKTRAPAQSLQGKDECLAREGNRSAAESQAPPDPKKTSAVFLERRCLVRGVNPRFLLLHAVVGGLRILWGRCALLGGLITEPLGFDEILEQLRNRTAALEGELLCEIADFGMDRQVKLSTKLAVWVCYSWHSYLF